MVDTRKDDRWEIIVAGADEETGRAAALCGALRQVAQGLFSSVIEDDPQTLIPPAGADRRLIVIPSLCTGELKKWFGELIKAAYGNNSIFSNELYTHRFLFIKCDRHTSLIFEGLSRVLEHLKVAKITSPQSALIELAKIVELNHGQFSGNALRNAIEYTCFPSGAEEMQEIYFRDLLSIHSFDKEKVAGQLEQVQALRLLIGAFTAGDIDQWKFSNSLQELGIKYDIEKALEQIRVKREKLKIPEYHKSPLLGYLKGRKILIIEDNLKKEGWHVALSALLQSEIIVENVKEEDYNGVFISHAQNTQKVLKEYSDDELHSFDLILLDLYSTEGYSKIGSGHVQAEIGHGIRKLCERLEVLQEKCNDVVPVASPKVVVFSADFTGLTTRTMIKELGASDYFFKKSKGESHKTEYYSTFRNTLITALKETICEVLASPSGATKQRFDDWFLQFLPADRPMILRIMKHFRFYSAMSMVKILDKYLSDKIYYEKPNLFINLFKAYSLKPYRLWFSYLGRPNKSGPATLPLLAKTKCLKDILKNEKREKNKNKAKEWLRFMTYKEFQENLFRQLISKLKRDDEKLCIVLVDDFIGSSGQLQEYLWKIFNDNKALKNEIGRRKINYFELLSNLTRKCELHILFVIGLHNNQVDKLLQRGEIRICNSQHSKWDRCDCKDLLIPYKLHIADHINCLKQICLKEKIDYSELKELLERYTCITQPRQNEYPCEFEPFGWKDTCGLTATYANSQGNTLPIIWGDGSRWFEDGRYWLPLEKKGERWLPLFHRFFNPWAGGGKELDKCFCAQYGFCELIPDQSTKDLKEEIKGFCKKSYRRLG